jgi:hypothetical protein
MNWDHALNAVQTVAVLMFLFSSGWLIAAGLRRLSRTMPVVAVLLGCLTVFGTVILFAG